MYYIYKHQNKLTGKTYIGCSTNPVKRWRNGRGYENNKKFFSDISTYGWDSFSHVILLQVDSLELASLLETELINQYQPEYNIKSYSNTGKRRFNNKHSKPVLQLSLEGEVLASYPSAAEAARRVPKTDFANISDCCHGRRKSSGGYRWIFKETA